MSVMSIFSVHIQFYYAFHFVLFIISLLDLKYALHSLRLSKIQKDIAVYYHILVAHHTYTKECLWD